MKIKVPAGITTLVDVDGKKYAVKKGVLTIPALRPWQLLALRAK